MSSLARSTEIRQLNRGTKLLIWFVAMVIKGFLRTLRCRIVDEAGFFQSSDPRPVVALMWHNRMLGMATAFMRYYPERKGAYILNSASRDGAYAAELVKHLGVGSIRGSSSRRGAIALIDLVKKVKEGYDLCITPDGPRGPRYKLSPGVVLLSQHCQVPLMPLLFEFSSCWRLKSWDGFVIPKPFSRIDLTILPLIQVPPTKTAEEFESERKRVEEVMRERLKTL
ncbi:MAG TPA: lysophospholipid acyltransferase family protein [Chthoniobacterales bacterium]|nr:lysophospholipid acyltransferase family protein [Chthoniobacterales bacterium]